MKITPCDLGKGIAYDNPFKKNKIHPFDKIGRCIVDKTTGQIKRWCGEEDSNYDRDGQPINLNEDIEEVMVYFPAFYYKRTWQGTQLVDEILDVVPEATEIQGYKVHPAFVRKDGSFREYILVGAFPEKWKTDKQMRSIPSLSGQASNIGDARTYARKNRDNHWNLMNIAILSMIQILYKVGFQNLDISRTIGYSGVNYNTKSVTMPLGNKSGKGVKKSDANLYYENTSLFGLENFYTSQQQGLDGCYVGQNGLYITTFPEEFGVLEKYELLEIALPSANGWIKDIHKIDGKFDCLNIPKTTSLTDWNNKYYSDYFYARTDSIGLFTFGGEGSPYSKNGIFSVKLDLNYSTHVSIHRLTYLP